LPGLVVEKPYTRWIAVPRSFGLLLPDHEIDVVRITELSFLGPAKTLEEPPLNVLDVTHLIEDITCDGRANLLYQILVIASVIRETVAFHLSLTGNSYSEIERSQDGTPLALWPLSPRLTRAVRLPNGDLAYETQDGETGGNKRIIAAANCLHVPLMSFDGIVGLSPIMQAARALGLAAASEKSHAALLPLIEAKEGKISSRVLLSLCVFVIESGRGILS
jgi:hypothetical protein